MSVTVLRIPYVVCVCDAALLYEQKCTVDSQPILTELHYGALIFKIVKKMEQSDVAQ